MNLSVKLYTDRVQPSIQPAVTLLKRLTFVDEQGVADCVEAISDILARLQKVL